MRLPWQHILLAGAMGVLIACAPSQYRADRESLRVVTVIPTESYESNGELARTESILAHAEEAGARRYEPAALAAGYDHLEKSRASFAQAEEDDEMDEDDDGFITSLWLAQKALADAEYALAHAEANQEEERLVELQRNVQALRIELKRMADDIVGGEE